MGKFKELTLEPLQVGDKVKAKLWNGNVIAQVTKIVGRCVFLDAPQDRQGFPFVVDRKVCTRIPTLQDIGYVVRSH